MQSNFSIIESKLDDFIRKFYSNRIVIGLILFVLISSLSLFTLFMIEGVAYLQPSVKTVLFFFAIFLFSTVFIFLILIPVLKIFKVIPYISYEEASTIISNHFSDSDDVLISILQLNNQNSVNTDLLIASINQKIDLISPLNFTNAINLKKTAKLLSYSVGILLILILLSFVFSSNFKQGASRFMDYSMYYEPANPYSLDLLNDTLYCAQGENFTVKVKLEGPTQIKDLFITNSDFNVRMNVDSTNYFSYSFENVTSELKFKFNYLNFSTDEFKVSVFTKPQVLGYSVQIIPPSYTKLSSQEFENTGDLVIPFGSKIIWNFEVLNAKDFVFYTDTSSDKTALNSSKIKHEKTVLKNFDYHFSVNGENDYNQQSNVFHVNLIPDYFPSIFVVSSVDSTASNSMYFSGRISDDYGFHSLRFVYFDPSKPNDLHYKDIQIEPVSAQDFYYYFDFSLLSKEVSYYFEVRDNDAVSGFKSTKSTLSVYTSISDKEKQERVDNLQSSIYEKVNSAQSLLRELNNDLQDFQKSVSSNKELSDWEKQLKLDNLLNKQSKLQSLLNEISQENQYKDAFDKQLSNEQNTELLKQQQQLQELWDQLLTDDIKELMDKISELANSINEKDFRDNVQNLKFDYNQISEQLDRNNTLMKKFNVENKLHNISDDLKEMSEEMKDLSDKLFDSKSNEEEKNSLKEKLDDLIEEFNQKYDDFKNLEKQNEELGDNKLEIPNLEDKFEEILNHLNDEKKDLESSDLKNKQEKQDLKQQMDDTSKEMEKLSDEINGTQKQNQQQKNQENLNDVRQILDNLLTVSFNQEKLIKQMNQNKSFNSYVAGIIQKQTALTKDFALVQDSIYALAKREPSLGHSVYDKIEEINSYFVKINTALDNNNRSSAANFQQMALTDINDLMLLFNEIEDQMQNQQQSSQSSDQQNTSSNSTKNKKQMKERQQNLQNMKSQQQSLKEQLNQMYQQLLKGNNPTNQQLAQSLKMAEMMQQQLQEMQNQQGNSTKEQQLLNQMKQLMEDSKRDIINRNINKSLIDKQNTMFNKLLDFENAEKNQEFEEKRESKQSLDFQNNDKSDLKFKFKNLGTQEFLNSPSLNLNLFYQNIYNEYLQNI